MNNMTIIANEAVASGFLTKEDVEKLKSEGSDIPFHTVSVWKNAFGMMPKKGTHGWEAHLWRKRCKKNGSNAVLKTDNDFYLTKCFLFHISQCEQIIDKSP